MTVRERILAYLTVHPEGVDDDALAIALSLSRRQHANQECRNLEKMRLIQRKTVNGKIRNFFSAQRSEGVKQQPPTETDTARVLVRGRTWDAARPWYWEGNVQAVAEEYLRSRGYRILKAANTAAKEHGKDIIAVSASGQELWATVKGQPERTPKTPKWVQARHYFSGALRDLLSWRGQSESVALALVLPIFSTYRNSTRKFAAQLASLKVFAVWVDKDGKVEAPDKLP
jgi:hypothetical protein